MTRYSIEVRLPDGTTRSEERGEGSVIIGSGPSAALRIEHGDVSSMHAVMRIAGDAVYVSDLGSETGTSVDGRPISDEVQLEGGAQIRLGAVSITVTPIAAQESSNVAKKKDKSKAPTEDQEAAEAAAEESATDAEGEEPAEAKADASAAEDARAAKVDHKKSEVRTELIRDPSAGFAARVRSASADADLDESLLSVPLREANQPTASKHALEITVHWGDTIIDSCLVSQARDVTVSGIATRHKRGDLQVEAPIPGIESHVFTIASNRGSEASIVVPAEAKVGLRDADGNISRNVQLSATDAPFPAKAFNLGFGERLAFKTGGVTFVAQYVRGDAEMGRKAPIDWYFPRIFIISALIHAFFVVAAFVTPKIQTSLTDDLFKNQNRFAQMILKAPEKEKKRKKLDLSGSKGGAKHKGDEGKFGKKELPKKDALASKAGAPRVDPNKREKDRKIAMDSGLLGILKGGGASSAVSNVFGPGGLGTGINNAMGGLRGSEMGDAGGAGGLGTRGAGAGGGGNSLGIGGLGTHGHGRGTGGYGNIDLGGRGKGTTRIVPGKTIIKGALSKEEIGRVIRRNLARFKYCYEKELNANPNLNGKVSVYFVIAPTGAVGEAEIRETSMNDENVESCVIKVMRSLKFPMPKGGGVVVVTYPFVFAAT